MKRGAGYFLAELTIVILGVSISLLMNDYMSARKSRSHERQLLGVISNNLELDSLNTWGNRQTINVFIKSSRALLDSDQDTPLDSFNLFLDHVTSYGSLQTVEIGFIELNNSGIELQNDSLYRSLLGYYSSLRPLMEEWNGIQRDFILQSMIPFVIAEFPDMDVAAEGNTAFAIKEIPPQELLSDSHYKNLLSTNLVYNRNMLRLCSIREQYLQALRQQLRDELKKHET